MKVYDIEGNEIISEEVRNSIQLLDGKYPTLMFMRVFSKDAEDHPFATQQDDVDLLVEREMYDAITFPTDLLGDVQAIYYFHPTDDITPRELAILSANFWMSFAAQSSGKIIDISTSLIDFGLIKYFKVVFIKKSRIEIT